MADTVTLPARQVFDLAGPTPQDRRRTVRVFRSEDGTGWNVYGEKRDHPNGVPVPGHDVVVYLPDLTYRIEGDAVEVKPGRRWSIGEWTLTPAQGCSSCTGRGKALRAWEGPQ